jgi:ubiquinone/menaquinone biosynthesis C-methylase UbiE
MTDAYWGKYGATYDAKMERVVGKTLIAEINDALQELPALGKVAEFGCGTGYYTGPIARKAENVVATDVGEELLSVAMKRFAGQQTLSFQREDSTSTSFKDGSFDTVFEANLLHVIEDPGAALRENHRVLREGGRLIVVSFTRYGMTRWDTFKLALRFLRYFGKPPRHSHTFSPDDLTALLESTGFKVVECRLLGETTKAVYAVARKGGIS